MNTVELKSTSLLDYIIYYRIKHLERLLGLSLYPHFISNGLNDVSDFLLRYRSEVNQSPLHMFPRINYTGGNRDCLLLGNNFLRLRLAPSRRNNHPNTAARADNSTLPPLDGNRTIPEWQTCHNVTTESVTSEQENESNNETLSEAETNAGHIDVTSKCSAESTAGATSNDIFKLSSSLTLRDESKNKVPSENEEDINYINIKPSHSNLTLTRKSDYLTDKVSKTNLARIKISSGTNKSQYSPKSQLAGKHRSLPVIQEIDKEYIRPTSPLKPASDFSIKKIVPISTHSPTATSNQVSTLRKLRKKEAGDHRGNKTNGSLFGHSQKNPALNYNSLQKPRILLWPPLSSRKKRRKKKAAKICDQKSTAKMLQVCKNAVRLQNVEAEVSESSSSYNMAAAFDNSYSESTEKILRQYKNHAVTRTQSDSSFSRYESPSHVKKRQIKLLSSPRSLQILLDDIMTEHNENENAKKLSIASVNQTSNDQADEVKPDENKMAAHTATTRFSMKTQEFFLPEVRESKSTGQQLTSSRSQAQQSLLTIDRDKSVRTQISKAYFAKSSMYGSHLSNMDSSIYGSRWAGSVDAANLSKNISEQLARSGVTKSRHFGSTEKSEIKNKDVCHKLQRGLNAEDLEHCETCGLGLWKLQQCKPKFFNLTLLHLTFCEQFKNHPSTVTKVVESTTTVYSLIELIKHEKDIPTNTLKVYKDKTRSIRAVLPPALTLEECGYVGSSGWYEPVDLTLYYEYEAEYSDCPILVSDYYFINRKKQTTK